MGYQIVKQPDGKFVLWSSYEDNFILADLTPDEIVEFFIKLESEKVRENVLKITRQLDNNEKPYGQFSKSFNDCIAWVKEIHGEKAVKKLKSYFSGLNIDIN